MAKKQPATTAKVKKEHKTHSTYERTRAVAELGIHTADLIGQATSHIFTDYVLGTDNPDPRIMLSAIGKRLNLESLKLRAAQISQGKKAINNPFFLQA